MPPTPTRFAESVVSQMTSAAARHSETWVRHFGMKCERTAPGQTPPSGFDEAIRHECWRAMMYGAMALAGESLNGKFGAPEIAQFRQALQDALFAAPRETGGDPAQTKARVAAYHASWKSGGAAGATPVLIAALEEAAGVKGTPFASAADAISKANAPDWLPYAAKVYKILLDRP